MLAARKARLERLLTIQHDPDSAARVAAIEEMAGDVGLDFRAALNPLLVTRAVVAPDTPPGANVARELTPGDAGLSREAALAQLVQQDLLQPPLSGADQRAALAANITDGAVAGVPVDQLSDQAARDRAYQALEAAGAVPPAATETEIQAALDASRFFEVYAEPDPAVTDAARPPRSAPRCALAR